MDRKQKEIMEGLTLERETGQPTMSQLERFKAIANDISASKSKRYIRDKYAAEWNLSPKTVAAIIKETILWIQQTAYMERESVKAINNERLDGLLDEAVSVGEKIKIIDLINKTNGVYEQNINLGNKDNEEIRFEIAKPDKQDDSKD